MRIVKTLLVLVFAAVAVLYFFQDMFTQFSINDEPPVLTCDSEILEVSVNDDRSALLSGVTATDKQDGDLSDQVLITGTSKLISNNTAKITYVVFDSDDNMATLTRSVRYTDYQLPRFSLDEALIYSYNQDIELLDRLQARDTIDGDVTDKIRVSYMENTDDPLFSTIDVQVTNSVGDTAWLTLPVIQKESSSWVDISLSTYLVYLEQGSRFNARGYLERASLNGNSLGTDMVSVSGDVDTDTPGTYYVRYTCSYGNAAGTVILTVVVE